MAMKLDKFKRIIKDTKPEVKKTILDILDKQVKYTKKNNNIIVSSIKSWQ